MSGLWAHQEQALSFVQGHWNQGHRGVMLAIIMGGGKSRVAVEAAARNRLTPVLIVCPLRVCEVWKEQFRQYGSHYDVLVLDDRAGSVADKTAAARDRLGWAIAKDRPLGIAINYESARLQPFAGWAMVNAWPLVIADEIHRTKQPSGALSRFVGRLGLCARYRLGLTGTPMPHSPLDVWAQFRFLDRTLYDPTYTSFRLRYAEMDAYFANKVRAWKNLEELKAKFFSRTFQVGSEVLDLPGEQDQILGCALAGRARRIYSELKRDLVAWIEAGHQASAANVPVQLLRLQQLTGGTAVDDQHNEHPVDTSKRQLLADLLEDLPPAEPVVVFARFKADLASIHQAAASLGRTSGEISGTRDDLPAWKRAAANDPTVLAVQIQAGGVGIDLTRAAYGVYYSTGFNLGDYLQSRARLYRAGQTRPVMFYHLIATDTVDETVALALARRQDLVESVLKELQCFPHLTPSPGR